MRARDCKPGGRKKRCHRFRLPSAKLHHEQTIRGEQAVRVGRNRAVTMQAINASVERAGGLEQTHLGLQRRDVTPTHVGRIGNHEIEGSFERGPVVTDRENSTLL